MQLEIPMRRSVATDGAGHAYSRSRKQGQGAFPFTPSCSRLMLFVWLIASRTPESMHPIRAVLPRCQRPLLARRSNSPSPFLGNEPTRRGPLPETPLQTIRLPCLLHPPHDLLSTERRDTGATYTMHPLEVITPPLRILSHHLHLSLVSPGRHICHGSYHGHHQLYHPAGTG